MHWIIACSTVLSETKGVLSRWWLRKFWQIHFKPNWKMSKYKHNQIFSSALRNMDKHEQNFTKVCFAKWSASLIWHNSIRTSMESSPQYTASNVWEVTIFVRKYDEEQQLCCLFASGGWSHMASWLILTNEAGSYERLALQFLHEG